MNLDVRDWLKGAGASAGILAASVLLVSSAQAATTPEATRGTPDLIAVHSAGFGVVSASSRTTALLVPATAVGQDAAEAEEGLGPDRPTRRLIQQGLRNGGFDPGAPDGLFGTRTWAAIRRWQEARGVPPSGYLDSTAAELLGAAGAPPPPVPDAAGLPAPPAADPQTSNHSAPASRPRATEASADSSAAAVNREDWNTEEFFERRGPFASAHDPASAVGASFRAREMRPVPATGD